MTDPFKTDDIFKGAKEPDFKKEKAALKFSIKDMQAEIDKLNVIIERYYDLCACEGGYECSICRDSMPFIKRLTQEKDEGK